MERCLGAVRPLRQCRIGPGSREPPEDEAHAQRHCSRGYPQNHPFSLPGPSVVVGSHGQSARRGALQDRTSPPRVKSRIPKGRVNGLEGRNRDAARRWLRAWRLLRRNQAGRPGARRVARLKTSGTGTTGARRRGTSSGGTTAGGNPCAAAKDQTLCSTSTMGPFYCCSHVCADEETDPANCGECGNPCASTQSCVLASCVNNPP